MPKPDFTENSPINKIYTDGNKFVKYCRKIQWPSILTTTNSRFWLAEKSDSNQPPTTWIRTHYEKLRKEDNKKWLIDNESKTTETDLVTLTGRLSKWKFS